MKTSVCPRWILTTCGETPSLSPSSDPLHFPDAGGAGRAHPQRRDENRPLLLQGVGVAVRGLETKGKRTLIPLRPHANTSTRAHTPQSIPTSFDRTRPVSAQTYTQPHPWRTAPTQSGRTGTPGSRLERASTTPYATVPATATTRRQDVPDRVLPQSPSVTNCRKESLLKQ